MEKAGPFWEICGPEASFSSLVVVIPPEILAVFAEWVDVIEPPVVCGVSFVFGFLVLRAVRETMCFVCHRHTSWWSP
jgi:hypothetical protein